MKWRPYPQYKDSGIDWLGEIPENWRIFNLKRLAQIIDGDRGKEYPGENDLKDSGIPFLSSKNIIDNKLNYSNLKYISPEKFNKLGRGKLNEGDIIITVRGTIGSVGLFKNAPFETAFINAQMMIIRPCFHLESTYFSYFAISKSFFMQINASSYGAAQQQLSNEILSSIIIVVPPINDQKFIAAFLDRETSRIDRLIEKKEKQNELLKEKRAALISHAVTKGLDPNVKMKDSGIEWLGEIPEGWNLIRIKRVVAKKITDGPHETPPFLEEGVPFISAEAIKNNRIDFSLKRGFISEDLHNIYCKKVKPRRDDILLIKSGATTGNIAMVETDEEFSIWSPLALIRADKKAITPKFLFYYLQADEFKKIIELSWSFGTQQNIGMGVIENLHCIIPPISYQNEITEILDRETTKIDSLIEKVQKSIELLKEYRTAIISAAVTGKIDVRNTA